MAYYSLIKALHVGTVAFNIFFFILRFYWMIRDSQILKGRWVGVLSVVNDTFLLAFGVSMAVISSQYPFRETWLTAKLVGLVVYVVLGTIALKRGETKAIRVIAGICSLFVVLYIVFVAISRMPIVFPFMPA